jgi:lysozyme
MKPRHQVTRAAIELIKQFEGYRRKAAQLPDGRWTIGYGHTLTARQGAEVSEEDAEALLLYDLIAVAHVVNEHAFATLTPNQFDALCAFAFNIGLDNFRRSAVLKRINEGALIQAAFAMELWRKADFEGERIVVDALVRRRSAEKTLFLTPQGGAWTAAPSPVLKPVLDLDGFDTAPRQTPTPIATVLDGERVLITRQDAPAPRPVEPTPAEPPSPIAAAAEEITARLQTIFPDSGEVSEPQAGPPPPAEPPAEAHPQADFAPPITIVAAEPPLEAAPEPTSEPLPAEPSAPSIDEPVESREQEATADSAPAGSDLLDQPEPANDLRDAATETPAEAEPRERVIIDDIAPFEFIPATVQSIPTAPPKDGLLTLVSLAVLGLAFFGGGIFWAANARDAHMGILTPLGVGLMAGLAGVGFFCVAVYLLLQRLARAAERRRDGARR